MNLPDGVAWVNRAAVRRSGLSAEPAAMADLLAPLMTGRQRTIETFKDDHRSRVQRIELAGGVYVWKQSLARPGGRRWSQLRHWLRLSPVWRNWRGAARLARAGVRTAEPLALVQAAYFGPGVYGLVMPSVQGVHAHKYLKQAAAAGDSDVAAARRLVAIARSVGRQIGQMTAQGLVNADHKPGNLLIDEACERDGRTPVIVDQSDIRRRHGNRQVYRMLATLLRTARRAAPISTRQGLACLEGMRKADPSFAGGARLSRVARRVLATAEGQ